MTLTSPDRSSRRGAWEASQQQQERGDNNADARVKMEERKRSPVRDVTPPRSGAESEDDDGGAFEEFDFDDTNSTCSNSEEPSGQQEGKGTWTREEHKRFLEAIKIYVNGPWKLVAEYVGTRTVRQTMTHAQKYRQKAARRVRGLRTKQAIMRMHCGHEVSEESMIQERLRTLLGQSRHAYLPPELCTSYLTPPGSPGIPGSPVMPGSPLMPGSPIMPGSPVMPGSPAMPGSPVMPSSPVGHHSPVMPNSPILMPSSPAMPSSPMMYGTNSIAMSSSPARAPPSLTPLSIPSLSLENPLSITIRSAATDMPSMPVYAPPSPVHSNHTSPATSPVSALTARMAQHGLEPRFENEDLEIIDDLTQGPTLEECANVLMEVLFDEPSTRDEPTDSILRSAPVGSLDIDI